MMLNKKLSLLVAALMSVSMVSADPTPAPAAGGAAQPGMFSKAWDNTKAGVKLESRNASFVVYTVLSSAAAVAYLMMQQEGTISERFAKAFDFSSEEGQKNLKIALAIAACGMLPAVGLTAKGLFSGKGSTPATATGAGAGAGAGANTATGAGTSAPAAGAPAAGAPADASATASV